MTSAILVLVLGVVFLAGFLIILIWGGIFSD